MYSSLLVKHARTLNRMLLKKIYTYDIMKTMYVVNKNDTHILQFSTVVTNIQIKGQGIKIRLKHL